MSFATSSCRLPAFPVNPVESAQQLRALWLCRPSTQAWPDFRWKKSISRPILGFNVVVSSPCWSHQELEMEFLRVFLGQPISIKRKNCIWWSMWTLTVFQALNTSNIYWQDISGNFRHFSAGFRHFDSNFPHCFGHALGPKTDCCK